jgi:hypothetical protein
MARYPKKLFMETTNNIKFKAVEFMRYVRNELSDLYHNDKIRYHKELKKSMTDFLHERKKSAATLGAKHETPQ